MIHDTETGWTEPTITINGRQLSFAEAMTVRVAVSSFRLFVAEPSNREGLGPGLAQNYDLRLAAVERYMREST